MAADYGRTNSDYQPERVMLPSRLVGVAAAVMMGILAARFELFGAGGFAAGLGIAAIAAGGLVAYGFRRCRRGGVGIVAATGMLWAGFFCLGGLQYQLVYSLVPDDHVLRYMSSPQQMATYRGEVVSEPYVTQQRRSDFSAFDYNYQPCTVFMVRCSAVQVSGQGESAKGDAAAQVGDEGWAEASGRVHVLVREPMPMLRVGQRVQIDGVLSQLAGPENPGQFDYRDVRRAGRVFVTCLVKTAEAVAVADDEARGSYSSMVMVERLRTLAYAALWSTDAAGSDDERGLSAAAAGGGQPIFTTDEQVEMLLSALVLGKRQDIYGEMGESFIRSGVVHFLSVSGMNVAVVAGFFWWLGRMVRLSVRWRGMAALLAIVVYLLIVPPCAPVIRAGCMGIVYCLATMFRRTSSPINLLAFSAIFLLLIRPCDLFNSGFQLSFIVVAGLILFVPVLTRDYFQGRGIESKGDADGDAESEGRGVFKSLIRRAGQALRLLIVASLVAGVVGYPLVVWHFNRMTLWAAPASVVLTPLVSVATIVGFVKVICAAIVPSFTEVLNPLLYWVSRAILAVTEWFAGLPGSGVASGSPPMAMMLSFYLILMAAAWRCYCGHRVTRWPAIALMVWGILFAVCWPFVGRPDSKTMTIDVLSVGHGCASVIRLPDERVMVYDAGSLTRFNVGNDVISPFLRSQGMGRIDAVVVSHPNIDHFNAVPALCRNQAVGVVYLNDYFNIGADEAGHRLLSLLQDAGQPVRMLSRGQRLLSPASSSSNEQYTIDILWPPSNSDSTPLNDNDSSTVVRIATASGSILLCGDLGGAAQRLLIELQGDQGLKSDVLLLPHHGSIKSLSPEFVAAVDPKLCLISGAANRIPSRETLATLLPGRAVYDTPQCGAIQVTLTPDGPQVAAFNKKHRR